MGEQVYKGVMNMEDVKRRHLQNGDRLELKFTAPWEIDEHRELLDGLGRQCEISISVKPDPQPELDGVEE